MTGSNTIAKDRLKSFVERVERLEEEKSALAENIKVVKAEAKSAGFDGKILNDTTGFPRIWGYDDQIVAVIKL